jgi:hypothetical protein
MNANRWFAACAAAISLAANAQNATSDARGTSGSRLTYDSAFQDYRAYSDAEVADWRRLNDELRDAAGDSGGHAGHMQVPATPSPSSAPARGAQKDATKLPASPMPQGQAAHAGHGSMGHSPDGGKR